MKFWGWFQQRRARGNDLDLRKLEQSPEAQQERIAALEEAVDRIVLASMGMWSLLRDQSPDLSEDDLLDRIREYDLIDGRLDGRLSPKAVPCASCSRMNHPRRAQCLYCSTALPRPLPVG